MQKIANIPARPKLMGLPTRRVIIITVVKTMVFEIRIERRKSQFTDDRFNCAKDMKIREGRENVPTNVLMPFDSVSEMRFIRPAKYPQIIIAKHCAKAG